MIGIYTILREYQKTVQPNDNLPTINIGDIVKVHVSTAFVMENGNYGGRYKRIRWTCKSSGSKNPKIKLPD